MLQIKENLRDKDRNKSVNSRFASPKSSRDVEVIQNSAVPKKTGQNSEKTWCSWALHHWKNMSQEKLENGHELGTKLTSMNTKSMVWKISFGSENCKQ